MVSPSLPPGLLLLEPLSQELVKPDRVLIGLDRRDAVLVAAEQLGLGRTLDPLLVVPDLQQQSQDRSQHQS